MANVTLRTLEMADIDAILHFTHNPAIYENVASIPPRQSRENVKSWLETETRRDRSVDALTFTRAILSDGAFAGLIGVFQSSQDKHYHLGYWVGEDYWGQGVASSAGALAIEHFRQASQEHALYAEVYFDNPASQRVLEKLGFQRMGTGKSYCTGRDKTVPNILFQKILA